MEAAASITDAHLQARARAALVTRRTLLLSLLSHALHRLRAALSTQPAAEGPVVATDALHALSLLRLLAQLPPLPASWTASALPQKRTHRFETRDEAAQRPDKPRAPPQAPAPPPGPVSHTPDAADKPFQRRTYYRSSVIDERRAPAAPWFPQPVRYGRRRKRSTRDGAVDIDGAGAGGDGGGGGAAAAAAAAGESAERAEGRERSGGEDTSSARAGQYGFAYGAFRVDHLAQGHPTGPPTVAMAPDSDADSGIDTENCGAPEAGGSSNGSPRATRAQSASAPALDRVRRVPPPPRRFFRPDVHALRVVTLRQCVFEIGTDGRIRRWSPAPF